MVSVDILFFVISFQDMTSVTFDCFQAVIGHHYLITFVFWEKSNADWQAVCTVLIWEFVVFHFSCEYLSQALGLFTWLPEWVFALSEYSWLKPVMCTKVNRFYLTLSPLEHYYKIRYRFCSFCDTNFWTMYLFCHPLIWQCWCHLCIYAVCTWQVCQQFTSFC